MRGDIEGGEFDDLLGHGGGGSANKSVMCEREERVLD